MARRSLLILLAAAGALVAAGLALAGCGSSGSKTPTVGAARVYRASGFRPVGAVQPGKPTKVAFTIVQPSGKPLTEYRRGSGPHTGVDLIIVRSDDSRLLYEDTDIGSGGRITQPVVFPTGGRYRVVIDAYPKQTDPSIPRNFQLFESVKVAGTARAQPLPPYAPTAVVDGYRFTLPSHLSLHALEPAFVTVKVHDPNGRPAAFSVWRGALAHAIFIRRSSLDYFHTHVCSPGATNCTSILGPAKVSGTSSRPGRLKVGVLVPVPGTWRLYLLTYIQGHQLTAPFTLHVT
jgi:hypothetical protein